MTELPLGLDVNPHTHRKTCKNPPRNPQNRKKTRNHCCITVVTTCTTNSEQIEVMELEGYSRPTCNKLCSSGHDASIVVGVIYKLDRRRVLWTTRPTCRGIIFQAWDKLLEESIFNFWGTRISLRHSARYDTRCHFNVCWKADASQIIYRITEPTTTKWKKNEKKVKTDKLRSIGKQSGKSVESVVKMRMSGRKLPCQNPARFFQPLLTGLL